MIRQPSNLALYRAAWRVANDVPARMSPCFRVVNTDGDRPKFYVYDVIGGWDLDAGEFVRALNDTDAEDLELHINSPGGLVYDTVAMYEALQDHDARVHVSVDGMAASAASILAMAGDTRKIAKGGRMMIHDAQVLAYGSPADLREAADLGEEVSDDISGFYADRAGGTPATWRAAMRKTTWYSSQEAVDAGLMEAVNARKSADTEQDQDGADNRSRLVMARHRALVARKG
jgi:ATP-dependent protease ClpP protease subunit